MGSLRQPGALPGAAGDSEMPRSSFSLPDSGLEHAFEGCMVPGFGLSYGFLEAPYLGAPSL